MHLFLSVALVQWLALMSPGPDFFFVSQTALARSRRQAMAGVVGIALGVAVWAALALLGLDWLLHRYRWLQRVLMAAGGAYLLWLGLRLFEAARRGVAGGQAAAKLPQDAWSSLRAGLLTNLSNPKALVYFGSVFSAFTGAGMRAAERWGLWLLVVAETLAWFALVVRVFTSPALRRGYLRAARWIDGAAGLVFLFFALGLLAGAARG
ncbi:LysE family transporter [Aerosticca soli]|uniref:Threonine efflux protein n=1 Tax=Aerosticca soli TaxID=2010829 RepID=A0A2Z6E3L3_9GAMM|nr:LysE family transporter [Aerosticca soli]BBD79351.1 threonine efflux protein [Aerosticca soli]